MILKRNMSFKQIIVNIDSHTADTLSDIFFDLNALSVSIEDQYEGTELEQPIFNEPGMEAAGLWDNSKINVLLDEDTNIEEFITSAISILGKDFTYTTESLDDQDWVRLTQSQFEPIKINENFYIVPSWHELPNKEAKSITLDPGLAFGTGSHPTTFMCLDWISKNISFNDSVLDYGCGSGILAIAAKIHGAEEVYGVDIDEQAIEASHYNAENNNTLITFSHADKLDKDTFNIVVANILSNPLRILAPRLAKLSNQILILSGILESQSDELQTIYKQYFPQVSVINTVEGWVLLKCCK